MSSSPSVPALLINDTRVDLHHGCSRVMRAIQELSESSGLAIGHAIPAHTEWRREPRHLRAFEKARIVIVNGEGSIHHDRVQGRWLLEAAEYARSLGIPAVLINASWQANGEGFASLLKHFALVALRDERSAAEVRSRGIECRVVPDMSLFFESPEGSSRNGIGFTDAVIREVVLEMESLLRRNAGHTAAIQYSGNGAAGVYRFFRNYVGKADLARPGVLLQTLRARAAQLRSGCVDDEAFMRQIANLRLLVTARFHAATFALAARTPLIMVAPPAEARETDGNKLVGLLDAAGLERWRLATTAQIDQKFLEEASNWHGDEKSRLEDFLRASRQRMRGLFTDIRALA
jgi:hypothetical protein